MLYSVLSVGHRQWLILQFYYQSLCCSLQGYLCIHRLKVSQKVIYNLWSHFLELLLFAIFLTYSDSWLLSRSSDQKTRALVYLHCFTLPMTLPCIRDQVVKGQRENKKQSFAPNPVNTAPVGKQKVPLLESLRCIPGSYCYCHCTTASHCQIRPLHWLVTFSKTISLFFSRMLFHCYFFKNYFCWDIIHIS